MTQSPVLPHDTAAEAAGALTAGIVGAEECGLLLPITRPRSVSQEMTLPPAAPRSPLTADTAVTCDCGVDEGWTMVQTWALDPLAAPGIEAAIFGMIFLYLQDPAAAVAIAAPGTGVALLTLLP